MSDHESEATTELRYAACGRFALTQVEFERLLAAHDAEVCADEQEKIALAGPCQRLVGYSDCQCARCAAADRGDGAE